MSRATHSNVSAYALVRVGLHYRRHWTIPKHVCGPACEAVYILHV